MISLIAAIGKNHELGRNGDLVFHLKDDMRFFRETTTGHPVIMGRKTWDSLPKKLKNRENIVLSSHDIKGTDTKDAPDRTVHDFNALLEEAEHSPTEYFVIGGGTIYTQFLPYADHLYLTEVDESAKDVDVFFPAFDRTAFSRQIIKKGKDHDLAYVISKYSKN